MRGFQHLGLTMNICTCQLTCPPFAKGLLLAAFCMAYASGAVADISTGVMRVSAMVVSPCVVGTPTRPFGNTDSYAVVGGSFPGKRDTTDMVTANCTQGSRYTVSLDVGNSMLTHESIPRTGSAMSQSITRHWSIFPGSTVSTGVDNDNGAATVIVPIIY